MDKVTKYATSAGGSLINPISLVSFIVSCSDKMSRSRMQARKAHKLNYRHKLLRLHKIQSLAKRLQRQAVRTEMCRKKHKNIVLDRKYPVYDRLVFIGRISDPVHIATNFKKLTFAFNVAHGICEKFLWLDLVSQCDYIPLMGLSLSLTNIRGDLHLLQQWRRRRDYHLRTFWQVYTHTSVHLMYS